MPRGSGVARPRRATLALAVAHHGDDILRLDGGCGSEMPRFVNDRLVVRLAVSLAHCGSHVDFLSRENY